MTNSTAGQVGNIYDAITLYSGLIAGIGLIIIGMVSFISMQPFMINIISKNNPNSKFLSIPEDQRKKTSNAGLVGIIVGIILLFL